MDVTRAIQVAVARMDLIVCTVLRWLAVIVPLTIILFLWVYTSFGLASADS